MLIYSWDWFWWLVMANAILIFSPTTLFWMPHWNRCKDWGKKISKMGMSNFLPKKHPSNLLSIRGFRHSLNVGFFNSLFTVIVGHETELLFQSFRYSPNKRVDHPYLQIPVARLDYHYATTGGYCIWAERDVNPSGQKTHWTLVNIHHACLYCFP